MKNYLLFAAATLFAASAAATVNPKKVDFKDYRNAQPIVAKMAPANILKKFNGSTVNFYGQTTKTAKATPATSMPAMKANKAFAPRKKAEGEITEETPALTQSDLYGYYVEDHITEGDGVTTTYECYQAYLEPTTVQDSDTGEDFEAVACSGLCQDYVYGIGAYYPSEQLFYMPEQIVYYDPEDTQVTQAIVVTLDEGEEDEEGNKKFNVYKGLFLTVDCDENGVFMSIDPERGTGWGLLCTEGTAAGYIVMSGDDFTLNMANYVVNGWEAWEDWEEAEPYYTYVEQAEDGKVYVHGFMMHSASSDKEGNYYPFPGGMVEIDVNEDNTFTMATEQPFFYNTYYKAFAGPMVMSAGDDRRLFIDTTIKTFNGFISATGAFCFGVPVFDEDGNQKGVNWANYILGINTAEGAGGWDPVYADTYMQTLEDYLEGINTVLAPATVNNSVFNLAGQRANKAQSGILIEDGKKVIR